MTLLRPRLLHPGLLHPGLLRPGLIVPLAAALGFVGLAALIASGHSFAFDRSLILLLRQTDDLAQPVGPAWFREAMRDVTALGSFVSLGAMTIVGSTALWLCGKRHLSTALWTSVVAATLVSTGLKLGFDRARPDIVAQIAPTFTASFPSGHAFLSSVVLLSIAGFVGLASRRTDIARVCLGFGAFTAAMIGISRVYLGVHWPTDVIAGWCLGIAWSSAAVAILGRWQLRLDSRAPGADPARA